MLGRVLARRVLGPDARSYAVGEFGELVIGGGRVRRATGEALAEAGIGFGTVEHQPERIRDPTDTSRAPGPEPHTPPDHGRPDHGVPTRAMSC